MGRLDLMHEFFTSLVGDVEKLHLNIVFCFFYFILEYFDDTDSQNIIS